MWNELSVTLLQNMELEHSLNISIIKMWPTRFEWQGPAPAEWSINLHWFYPCSALLPCACIPFSNMYALFTFEPDLPALCWQHILENAQNFHTPDVAAQWLHDKGPWRGSWETCQKEQSIFGFLPSFNVCFYYFNYSLAVQWNKNISPMLALYAIYKCPCTQRHTPNQWMQSFRNVCKRLISMLNYEQIMKMGTFEKINQMEWN